jgi:ketosteroid isomerase-like protein
MRANVEIANDAADPASLVRRFAAALTEMNLEAVGQLFAADAEWDVVGADFLPGGHFFSGRDAILTDFLAGTVGVRFDLSQPFLVSIDHIHVAGATAIAEWRVKASAAIGGQYDNHYCVVFETRAGLIVAVREYANTEYAKRVLFGG